MREQARDEKLQSRIRKINEKQVARIKQIETQEARNQKNELHKLVQRSYSYAELKPSQSQKSLTNVTLDAVNFGGEGRITKDPMDTADSFDGFKQTGVRESLTTEYLQEGSHPKKSNINNQQFHSSKEEYFNTKINTTNTTQL